MILDGRDGRRLKDFGGKAGEIFGTSSALSDFNSWRFWSEPERSEHSSTLFVKIEQTLNEVK